MAHIGQEGTFSLGSLKRCLAGFVSLINRGLQILISNIQRFRAQLNRAFQLLLMVVELLITIANLSHHLIEVFVELANFIVAVLLQHMAIELIDTDLLHGIGQFGDGTGDLPLQSKGDDVRDNDGEHCYHQRRGNIERYLPVEGVETGANGERTNDSTIKLNGAPNIQKILTEYHLRLGRRTGDDAGVGHAVAGIAGNQLTIGQEQVGFLNADNRLQTLQ